MATKLIVLFALAVLGYVLFHRSGNAGFKRRYVPALMVFMATLVTVMSAAANGFWWLVAPMGMLMAYRQVKNTRFCDFCGATSWMPRASFCASCGARLAE